MTMGMLKNIKTKEGRWITLDWDHIDGDVIEAGMPIGEDGQIHNDEAAVGILLKSCDRAWNHRAEVMIEGRIDEAERQALTGIELSKACLNALRFIQLQTNGQNCPFVYEAVAGLASTIVAG